MESIEYRDGYAYYDGHKFRKDIKSGYYLSTAKIDGNRKRLHVYVWEKFNGPVPQGYNIHHFDENKNDNQIDNLMCMTKSEHHTWHAKHDRTKMIDKWRKNLDKARIEASKWHKTPEGREVMSESHKGISPKKRYVKKCKNCGKSYRAAFKRSKFCSPKCQTAYRKKTGIDDEERTCALCDKIFTINRYSTEKCCSKKCRDKLRFKNNAGKARGWSRTKDGHYIASVSYLGKRVYLGQYEYAEEAHQAYLKGTEELIKTF